MEISPSPSLQVTALVANAAQRLLQTRPTAVNLRVGWGNPTFRLTMYLTLRTGWRQNGNGNDLTKYVLEK